MIAGNILKTLIRRTIQPFLKFYLNTDRNYTFKGIKVIVYKGVFHPGFFFSTKILLGFLQQFSISGKSFLELGAGTGLISVFAAKKGALVTASDINYRAIENIQINAVNNYVNIRIIHSNLFDAMPSEEFDYIVINPPYYKKQPLTPEDFAWNCGENLEYFQKLFAGLRKHIHAETKIIFILSDNCDLDGIELIAKKNHFNLILKKKYLRFFENNFVFEATIIPC